jgi:hypothetical protein
MVSTSGLRGMWQGGKFVGNTTNVAIALYVNAAGGHSTLPEVQASYKAEQRACFTILKEWVRQHIREKDEMYVFNEFMTEVDGRGYMFQLDRVKWGNDNDPFYLLLQRTLKDMAEAFNCEPHSNHSTPYALEYSWVKGGGMEYDTVRLGNYAYAVGVKVEVETAADFFLGEEL